MYKQDVHNFNKLLFLMEVSKEAIRIILYKYLVSKTITKKLPNILEI